MGAKREADIKIHAAPPDRDQVKKKAAVDFDQQEMEIRLIATQPRRLYHTAIYGRLKLLSYKLVEQEVNFCLVEWLCAKNSNYIFVMKYAESSGF